MGGGMAQLQTFLITTLTRYGDSVAAARREPQSCPLGDHRACRQEAHTSISRIAQVCEKGWYMSNNVVEVRALSQFRRTVEQWHRLELCVTITAGRSSPASRGS